MDKKKDRENEDIDDYTVEEALEKVEVDVRFMTPGSMLVGKSFDKHGNKIKNAYETFSKQDIEKLLKYGITELYYIPEVQKSSIKDNLPKLHNEEKSKSVTDKQYALIDIIRLSYEQIKKKKDIDINLLRRRLNNLLEEFSTKKRIIIQLLKTSKKFEIQPQERIFTHSVNVATLSMITSIHLRLKESVILDVSLAALLHDIGFANIDLNILSTPYNLTDNELKAVYAHPHYSYEILKSIADIDKNILIMVSQHHEYLDKSGYPKRISGKEIFPLTHIISTSEMYDSLISNKPFVRGIEPSKALLYILLKAGKSYHKKIANAFVKSVCEKMRIPNIFPEESRVILNTNEIAVVKQASDHTLRPKIEIVKDSNHTTLKRTIPVDLSSDGTREIIRVLKLSSGDVSIPQADLILKHFF